MPSVQWLLDICFCQLNSYLQTSYAFMMQLVGVNVLQFTLYCSGGGGSSGSNSISSSSSSSNSKRNRSTFKNMNVLDSIDSSTFQYMNVLDSIDSITF